MVDLYIINKQVPVVQSEQDVYKRQTVTLYQRRIVMRVVLAFQQCGYFFIERFRQSLRCFGVEDVYKRQLQRYGYDGDRIP